MPWRPHKYRVFEKNTKKIKKNSKKVLAKTLHVLYNHTWLVGQAAKTSPSHGEIRGSIPLRAANEIRGSD